MNNSSRVSQSPIRSSSSSPLSFGGINADAGVSLIYSKPSSLPGAKTRKKTRKKIKTGSPLDCRYAVLWLCRNDFCSFPPVFGSNGSFVLDYQIIIESPTSCSFLKPFQNVRHRTQSLFPQNPNPGLRLRPHEPPGSYPSP